MIYLNAVIVFGWCLPILGFIQSCGYRLFDGGYRVVKTKLFLTPLALSLVHFAATFLSQGVLYCVCAVEIIALTVALCTGLTRQCRFTPRFIRLSVACAVISALNAVFIEQTVAFCGAAIASHYLMLPFENLNRRCYILCAKRKLSIARPQIVAITGSYGKTSVKSILSALMPQACATTGNYNTPMGVALTVNRNYADEELFIAEMGARRKGDIRKLTSFVKPSVAVITGITAQHMETFKTLDAIIAEKLSICVNAKTVYNADCPLLSAAIAQRNAVAVQADTSKPITEKHNCKTAQSEPIPNITKTQTDKRETAFETSRTQSDKRETTHEQNNIAIEKGIAVSESNKTPVISKEVKFKATALSEKETTNASSGRARIDTDRATTNATALSKKTKDSATTMLKKTEFAANASNRDAKRKAAIDGAGRIDAYGCGMKGDFVRARVLANGMLLLQHNGQSIICKKRLLGRHNASNIAVAVGAAILCGMQFKDAARVSEVQAIEHRLSLSVSNGIRIIDDAYSANLEGIKAALEVLKAEKGKRFLVTSGIVEGGKMQSSLNRQTAELIVGAADYVYLVGVNANEIARHLTAEGFESERITLAISTAEAAKKASHYLKSGDTILFMNDLPTKYI